MQIGSLEIQLLADVARLRQDMDQVKGTVGGAMRDVQKAVDLAKTALVALTGVASVAAFASMIKGAIDGAAALNDLSIETGASVEALSALASVGKTSDTSARSIADAMNKLSKNMAVATEDSKGAAQAVRALGINFDDFQRMSPEERMQAVAKAMNGFADGSGKTAAAMALFGKEGAKLLPFLKDLADTGQLQARVTAEQAAMADNFSDNLTKLSASGDAWKKELAMGMLPALNEAGQAILDVTNGSGGLRDGIRQLAKDGTLAEWTRMGITALTYLADGVQYVIRTVKVAGEFIGSTWARLGAQFTGVAEAAQAAVRGDFSGALTALQRGFKQSETIANEFKKTAVDTFSEPTLGQRIRDRMKDIQNLGTTSDAAKPKVRMSNEHDENAKAAKKQAEEYAKLTEKIGDQVQALQAEEQQGAKLSQAQKTALDVMVQLQSGALKLSEAQKLETMAKLEHLLVLDKERQVREAEAKWMDDSAKANDRVFDSLEKQTEALRDQVRKQEEANLVASLGAEALADLEVKRLRDAAATAEQNARSADLNMIGEQTVLHYKNQAEALSRLADEREKGVHIKAAKEAADEWKKTTDSIYNGLTDSLFRAFESGKDFFHTLWDGIKNTFKSTVLKVAIQGVMSPIQSMMGQVLGGVGQTAGQMASGAGGLDFSSMTSLLGGMGTMGTLASFGATGFMSTLAGTGLGTSLGAAGSLMAGGNIAGGLGMGMGALGPYALAAAALYAVFGDHSKWSHGGWGAGTFGAGGFTQSGSMPFNFGNNTEKGNDQALRDLTNNLSASVSAYASGLGGSGPIGYQLAAMTDLDRTNKVSSQIAYLLNGAHVAGIQTGTGAFGSGYRGGAGKMDAANLEQWFKDSMPITIVQGLQLSNLPAKFKEYFNSVAPASLTADKAQQMLATAGAVKQLTDALSPLGGVFAKLGTLSVQATGDLADLVGGVDALISKSKSFVQNYYSQEEQTALAAKGIAASLKAAGIDITGLDTKAEYRSLLDSLGATLNDPASQAKFAALLNASDAFAQIEEALRATGMTLEQAAQLAPATAMLDQAQSQTQLAQQTADSIVTLIDGVSTVGDAITGGFTALQASMEAGLGAIAGSTQATQRLLEGMEGSSGGLLVEGF